LDTFDPLLFTTNSGNPEKLNAIEYA